MAKPKLKTCMVMLRITYDASDPYYMHPKDWQYSNIFWPTEEVARDLMADGPRKPGEEAVVIMSSDADE